MKFEISQNSVQNPKKKVNQQKQIGWFIPNAALVFFFSPFKFQFRKNFQPVLIWRVSTELRFPECAMSKMAALESTP